MNYYILLNGQQAGPYTEDHLRMFLSAGQVKPGDLVWREGLAEWAPLSAVLPDLVDSTKPAPASAPVRKPATVAAAATAGTEPAATSSTPAAKAEEEEEEEGNSAKKWILAAIGVVVLGVIVLGSAIGWYVYEGGKYDVSSKAYADDYINHIAPDWSADDFLNHVAPPYRDQFKRESLDRLFAALEHLGDLQHYDGSSGQSHISIRSLGKNVSAQYDCRGTFDRGEATFSLTLLQYEGKWTISGLRVDSPLFHPRKPAPDPAPPQ